MAISHESHLSVAQSAVRDQHDREVLLLGDCYDPKRPWLNQEEICEDICENTVSWDDLHFHLSLKAGRYLMVCRIGNDIRIYPDACCSMNLFYARGANHESWLSNSPALLAQQLHLSEDDALVSELSKDGVKGLCGFPGSLTNVKGVLALPANHWISPTALEPVRFYEPSNNRIRSLSCDYVAEEMLTCLTGTLKAMANRAPVVIGLTAGFDSRVVLAAALRVDGDISFISQTGVGQDAEIASRLANSFGFPLQTYDAHASLADFDKALYTHSMGLDRKRLSTSGPALAKIVPEKAILASGCGGEVGRAYYYKDGYVPAVLDASYLCKKTEYGMNTVARQEFRLWLDTLSDLSNERVLDLFFWEQHLGRVNGAANLSQDMLFRTVLMFNNRNLYEAMLGVQKQYRIWPYLLFQKACAKSDRRLLNEKINGFYPYNWNWRKKLADKTKCCMQRC